uniref:Nitrophorin domain-containing protein n=1 Tax=Rhodnius prolixus TaxID=13249 RepID=T1HTC8_RHOPR
MKTCVALVLLSAILRLSTAGPRPSRDRKCRNPDPKENFEPEKFFKNKWYTTHYQLTKYGLEGNTMNCIAFSSIVFSNGRIKEVFSNYQPNHCAYAYDVSYSSLDSFKDRVGKYTAQNVVVDRKGKRLEEAIHEYNITIIDTDYTRYAFVHLCGQDKEGLYFGREAFENADMLTSQRRHL